MPEYKHSESFSRLKSLEESIKGNLTSYQYLNSFDTLIYNALLPIVESTKYVDVFLAKVLAWQATNPKRKSCGVGRHALTSYVVLFFLIKATDKKVDALRKSKLDRGILVEIIRRWLAAVGEYETLSNLVTITEEQRARMLHLEALACLRPSHSLYGVLTQVKYWYKLVEEFKSMILEKYTRLCLNKAQQDYVQLGHRVDLEDIIQVYLMAASKAIDKCDTEKGVLTTHVLHWLMSAKNTVMANYVNGVAFQIPNQVKVQANQLGTTVPLDELEDEAKEEDEDEGEREDRIVRIRKISRIFDPTGHARLMLGVQEILTVNERKLLRSMEIKSVDTNL